MKRRFLIPISKSKVIPSVALLQDDDGKKKNRFKYKHQLALWWKVKLSITLVSMTLLLIGLSRHRFPPLGTRVGLYKEELEPWESPIIHIINTRFMQHQGNLTTLAAARLHLFKTICLPSILHQTSHDFLWIIKIDPDLNIDVRNELIEIIHQGLEIKGLEQKRSLASLRERIFVIGSNVNFNYGAWRGGTESAEVLSHHVENRIHMGNVDLLKMAKKAEPDKIVLESRLDADDGLNYAYIAYLHQEALRKFDDSIERTFKWFYWCVETHFKWYVSAEGEYGQLGGDLNNKCVTPGLTTGFNVGTSVEDVPMYGHQDLLSSLQGSFSCMKDNDVGHKGEKDENEKVPCVDLVSGFIGAVRARTATSAGMNDVKGQIGTQDTDILWDMLEERFGIMVEDAIETKRYFEENMKEITKENLEGQCRPGHSCKESSQKKLVQIIEDSEQSTH